MGFWKRMRDRWRDDLDEEPVAPEPPDLAPPVPVPPAIVHDDLPRRPLTDLERLAYAGQPGGASPAEAISILRRVKGTPQESPAIEALLGGSGPLTDEVAVACAEMLAARGDETRALKVLARTTSTAGLILAADLWAASGQLAKAAGTIERVLARDIDAPGARERHRRWREALGFSPSPTARHRLEEATMMTAKPETTSFRLLREIARGGAGTVYEGEDLVLGRRVAFKVYHRGAEDRALLSREVRLAASLAGPGVIRIYDASPAEGWVAMEWVARGSLRDMLRAGAVGELVPLWRWAVPLAHGLARIHDRGVVHGDIKPANVLLRASDDPILGDFGIARPIGDQAGGGSPGYMSPERLGGAPSDPGDDVYGFGRIVEDVLVRSEGSRADGELDPGGMSAAERSAAERLVLGCLAPSGERPADGAALARWLEDLSS